MKLTVENSFRLFIETGYTNRLIQLYIIYEVQGKEKEVAESEKMN
jgi:hypothetical protein